ncbi:MAG: glycoside hydrolase family 127 protein [Methylacidiphilales bacterium]|nr:glycoside hydrolase family 127 protein [Candidatus Methylacidiphilales bacterium]
MTTPLTTIDSGVHLLPGLFQHRAQLTRNYVASLTNEGLLQNFELEAGLRKMFHFHSDACFQKAHWGWESPTSELRGQFLGCWMMAAARFAQQTDDPIFKHKLETVIERLALCQKRNGGEWLSSFPEKFMRWLAEGTPPWVPHGVIHKTLLGLRESYLFCGNEEALEMSKKFVAWLHRWFTALDQATREMVLDVETCGMLEELARLYEITRDPAHLELARLYSRERFWKEFRPGADPLTNRHANTTIAEVHGAAAMYEVTGEQRWRDITEAYWKCAVTDRGTFCTGGQNSGEIWCPPHEFAARLGDKNQEHCTVYNMIRLADYLYRWTGESTYADYIEKNLYNGILAGQNGTTGMVTYYLPLAAGSKKKWGHPTRDFWCCHCSLVQIHSLLPSFIYYASDKGIDIAQYIPSRVERNINGVKVEISQDWAITRGGCAVDNATIAGERHRPKSWSILFKVKCDRPAEWSLCLRIPDWVAGPVLLRENAGETVLVPNARGFVELRRTWDHAEFTLILPRTITLSAIPDEPETVAFLEGPVVLAAITEEERRIEIDPARPEAFLVPENERQWGQWNDTFRLKGQARGLRFKPLYDITDEAYAVYFPTMTRTTPTKDSS